MHELKSIDTSPLLSKAELPIVVTPLVSPIETKAVHL